MLGSSGPRGDRQRERRATGSSPGWPDPSEDLSVCPENRARRDRRVHISVRDSEISLQSSVRITEIGVSVSVSDSQSA